MYVLQIGQVINQKLKVVYEEYSKNKDYLMREFQKKTPSQKNESILLINKESGGVLRKGNQLFDIHDLKTIV